MTESQTRMFIKRFAELAKRRRDVDYDEALLARDLLGACSGSAEFLRWCSIELGFSEFQSQAFLDRAFALRIVPDADTWAELGGFDQIHALLKLPRKEQVTIIGAAKVNGYRIKTIIRQRGHAPAPSAVEPGASNDAPARASQKLHDADKLAKFIAETMNIERLPPDVQAIVKMYAPQPFKIS